MSNYDFKQLSPHDFEQLARDLIQARDGILLESFKPGRDQGIDFRHARAKDNIIVQCKHYVGTGLSGLVTDLKKEVSKARKINPTRYILVTSVALTPLNKAEIQKMFGDMLSVADIIGQDDCNNLLGLYGGVEQRHHKLWLTSRAVLDRVVHNASVTQSELDVERVYREVRRYVRSATYPRAIEILNSGHVAIISGVPGVGKTTLARMILYAFVSQGYEAISILTDFQTGRERFQPGKKQIFYFDDFLGATFLGERASTFTRNEDRAILDFIELVRRSPTARLVMTTREHILRQAIATSEKLKHSQLIDNRCVLEIGDYSRQQRAEILYNHIYFSDLPNAYREALLAERFYRAIIDHPKFNPRLIEWLSSFQRVSAIIPEHYQNFVRSLLADPAEIWRHAYEQEISDAARSILLALYSFNGKSPPERLESAFRVLHLERSRRYGFKTGPSDWRRALSELAGAFIKPGDQVEVIDPSVLDMLNSVFREDTPNAIDIVDSAVRFEQVWRIWSVANLAGNQALLDHLILEEDKITTALRRLLGSPLESKLEDGINYVDSSVERRVATLVGIAQTVRSESLVNLARSTTLKLLDSWKLKGVRISDGVGLMQRIENSKDVFPGDQSGLRAQILEQLAASAVRDANSEDLRELINAIEPEKRTDQIMEHLKAGVEFYRSYYFSRELNDCKSGSEFDGLEEDLVTICEGSGVSLVNALQTLRETKEEFEEHQSQYEDQQYEEWKESRHEVRASESALDDMFDSLRSRP